VNLTTKVKKLNNMMFSEYVHSKFPGGIENLHKSMPAHNKYKVTYYANGTGKPESMTLDELLDWSKVLERNPSELINEFGCGKDKITIGDLDAQLTKEGLSFEMPELPYAA
jgi:hypothetical protein